MKHAVVIASTGRPYVLEQTLVSLAAQTRPADVVVLSLAELSDAPMHLPDGVQVVLGPRGLTRQRNAGLDALDPDIDLVTFLDDDAEPAPDYLEKARRFAQWQPEIVLFDGFVVADGVVTGEVSRGEARGLLADHVAGEGVHRQLEAYGCNMNVRRAVAALVRFDERLPLYGWLEDRDFAIRCGRLGPVVRYDGCAMVHLGTTSGRIPGTRLGWSQVVNPYYLWRKGVLSASQMAHYWLRGVGGNVQGLLRADPLVDRRGRLAGNLRGIGALLRGRGPEAVPAQTGRPVRRPAAAGVHLEDDAQRSTVAA